MSVPGDHHAPIARGPTAVALPIRKGNAREFVARLDLARAWPSLAALGTVGVLLVVLGYQAGGYFPADSAPAGAVGFVVLAVLLAVRRPHWQLSTTAMVALAALVGLTAWTGASAAWSPVPDAALEDMQRDAVYVAVFGLALLAAGSGRQSGILLWTSLAVCAVIAGGGLLSRLVPALIDGEGGAAAVYRLSYPLTYWNALGAIASTGAVLGLGLAADPRSLPWSRGLAAAVTVLLTTTMYLTLSRASWLALIGGVAVLLALGAHRGSLVVTVTVVGAATTLALARLQAYPALIEDPTLGAGQRHEGARFAIQLGLLAGGAGIAVALLSFGRRSAAVMDELRRHGPRIGVAALALVAVIAFAAYVVRADAIERQTARALGETGDWVSRQWDAFMQPAVFGEAGRARLTTARGTRSDLYRVAIDGFEADPLHGGGAGSFEPRWYRTRSVNENATDVHSLHLEVLSELGLVGTLLLLALLGAIGTAAVRSRLRRGTVTRAQAAAAGAACSVWLVHSFVDWDWQMPAVSGITLLIAAAIFPAGRRRTVRAKRPGAAPSPN